MQGRYVGIRIWQTSVCVKQMKHFRLLTTCLYTRVKRCFVLPPSAVFYKLLQDITKVFYMHKSLLCFVVFFNNLRPIGSYFKRLTRHRNVHSQSSKCKLSIRWNDRRFNTNSRCRHANSCLFKAYSLGFLILNLHLSLQGH